MPLITFHSTIRGCEQGRPEAWRQFLSQYSPVASALGSVYLPRLSSDWNRFWEDALRSLAADDYRNLRGFDHQGEREFLLDFRAYLLERGAQELDASQDFSGPPQPTRQTVAGLLNGLPLMHQSILLLKLAGYSDATLEKIFTIAPAIAEESLERLRAEYSSLLGQTNDVCRWPAAWLKLLRELHAARGEPCTPPRMLVRMLDGQISWYEKEPVESHMAGCASCLEAWTALREVVHWRREARPWPVEQIEASLSALPIANQMERPRSFLQRVFGVSKV